MALRLSASSTGVLLLPLFSLVACGGGTGGSTADEGATARTDPPPPAAAGPESEPEPVEVEVALPSDLDGRSIRHVGLARFDVSHVDIEFEYIDAGIGSDTSVVDPTGDRTTAEAAFTTLDEPLDDAVLARIGAMPGAGAVASCYPVDGAESRSIGTLLESLGTPVLAGEAITVSRTAGSWFELRGYADDPFYEMYTGQLSYFGIAGGVEAGTTIDVPGDAFPAFAAVDVPPVGSLSGVVENDTEVRWNAGADPDVPVVIDVRFHDYVEIRPNGSGTDGALTDDEFGYVTDWDIHTLVEAPADMRCVTRDTGRFAYPDALRATMAAFREAGWAVAGTVLPGSDLGTNPFSGIDANGSLTDPDLVNIPSGYPDGSLTDEDLIEVTQGRVVGVSRVATRYRVEGDALLIVQSSNGGTL